jgi:hypothetical protein
MKFFVISALSVALLMSLSPALGSPSSGKSDALKKPNECEEIVDACCTDKICDTSCSSSLKEQTGTYEDFIKLANDNLIRSWEYLFVSAQFGTHVKQRPGFEKILHGLADETWNKGFEMIKEAAKRGFTHSFAPSSPETEGIKSVGNLPEIKALANAVDIEKSLLYRANAVHLNHQHAVHDSNSHYGNYDSAIAHYLEEEIVEKKTENIRSLVGHVNDLEKLFKNGNDIYSMSLYLFDQYLQK